jgi:hypothetical protein
MNMGDFSPKLNNIWLAECECSKVGCAQVDNF